ncbi:MAG: phosphatase PAP2 family protein [Deltaproteobacteria bacterium]|nr:phosphatase PAP2 family protein [Deltaproteobacteria bacterium]
MRKIAQSLIVLLFVTSILIPASAAYADDTSKQPVEGGEEIDTLFKAAEPQVQLLKRDAGELADRTLRLNQRNALIAGGLTLGIIGLGLFDDDIRRSFQRNRTGTLDDIAQGFDFLGSTAGTLITNFSLVGIGWLNREYEGGRKLFRTAGISSEAQTFAGLITWALKLGVGRARPQEEKGTSHFKPFHSFSTSFPSGHTAQAWAMAAVFADRYDPPAPMIAYGYATLMGLSRVYSDRHFASDVLAGAALGYLIGKSISHIHKEFDSRVSIAPFVLASNRGRGISFNYRF